MNATRDEIARLAFAKYLLSLAARQSVLSEPLASVGLLLLHDATEHLLLLCCYHVGSDPKKSTFSDYWDLISKADSSLKIPEKGRMGAFNDARVALKHKGVQPSRAQLVEFQNLVLSFFDAVVPMVFGQSFNSINLNAFVQCDAARKRLESGAAALEEGRFADATTEAAYAFDDVRRSSPLYLHTNKLRLPSAPAFYVNDDIVDLDRTDYFKSLISFLEEIDVRMSVLELGLDFSRYTKFRSTAPEILGQRPEKRRHHYILKRDEKLTREDAEFCLSFVLDSAFRIQEHPEIPRHSPY